VPQYSGKGNFCPGDPSTTGGAEDTAAGSWQAASCAAAAATSAASAAAASRSSKASLCIRMMLLKLGGGGIRSARYKTTKKCGASFNLFPLKGLSHEIDFKNFDKILQNLAYLRDAAGF
jgi:hypothetical protein